MKNPLTLRLFPAGVSRIGDTLPALVMLMMGISFLVSCQKNADEQFAEATVENPEALTGESVAATAGATYYVSPTGNDNNNGSINSPFKTLNKAWTMVTAGDLVYLRGGTYNFTEQQYLTGKNGTAGNLIKVWNYPGEKPNLTTGTGYPSGGQDLIYFQGNYLHFKGLEISYATRSSGDWAAMRSENSNNCIFENLDYHHNEMGFTIRNCNNNLVLNSDFHHNQDAALDNADGINITYISNGNYSNTIRGCRAWNNSDDGFDLWSNNGHVLIENSWAWKNGYQQNGTSTGGDGSGFKLGEYSGSTTAVKRTIQNCISANNRLWGFNENNCKTGIQLYNNIAYNNGNKGYWFGDWGTNVMTVRNNANYGGSITFNSPSTTASHNSWQNGISVTNADFVNTDFNQLLSPRNADGSLPGIQFLQLASGSDLINAGVNVGIPYNGSAPDIGAFESGGSTSNPTPPPPAPNQAPTANAGSNKTITLPTSTVTLTGSGSDPDGTIVSYGWTRVSGPNNPVLSGAAGTTLSVSSLVAGSYVFRLTVTDNAGATGSDDVNVTVNSSTSTPPSVPPTGNLVNSSQSVSAGGYGYYVVQDFGTPADNSSNPNQSVLRIYENGVELTPPHSAHSDISNLGQGRFSHWSDGSFVALYFSASDNTNPATNGRVYTYTIGATPTTPTTPAPNQAPSAQAGADKTITLPKNYITINGNGSDPDGTIVSYAWTKISGPSAGLSGKNTKNLKVTKMKRGVYVFRLTVTDNGGLTSTDDVKVTVNAAITGLPINVSSAVSAGGKAYYVVQNFGTPADNSSNPTQSKLRIYENGVELTPPHASHSDISNYGQGRYSHWSDGSFVALYFSASDNTNPKTNGRTYTYTIAP